MTGRYQSDEVRDYVKQANEEEDYIVVQSCSDDDYLVRGDLQAVHDRGWLVLLEGERWHDIYKVFLVDNEHMLEVYIDNLTNTNSGVANVNKLYEHDGIFVC